MSKDYEIFPGKTLNSLFQDIYNNQFNKKKHISDIVMQVRDMIKTNSDMAAVGPVLKDLIDISVKNDDLLIKLATIAQRIYNNQNKGGSDDGILSQEERDQLLKEIDDYNNNVTSIANNPTISKASKLLKNKDGTK